MSSLSTIRSRLRPEEAMTLVFFAVLFMALAGMSASHAVLEGPAAAYPGSFVRLLFLVASVVVFLALIRFRPQWDLARDSMPFVFCGNVYASLHDLIRYAHNLPAWRLSGIEPNQHFITIAAKVDARATPDDIRLMLRQLLVDRFKLVSHTRTEERRGIRRGAARPGSRRPSPPRPDR